MVSKGLLHRRSGAAVNLDMKYIEDNIGNSEISVEDAAMKVHFSVSYVRQIFKEKIGENFNECVIRIRMEMAAEYLKKTPMKIQEISELCGYENQRYFARSFKKYYGCSPTEYKIISEKQSF